jgi:NAD(P)-dependent dehydrogenase (short-subunit alcohol dehydrogenase family)
MVKTPLGIGAPEDVVEAIRYLLSDQTKWMTGTELRVDGGSGVT